MAGGMPIAIDLQANTEDLRKELKSMHNQVNSIHLALQLARHDAERLRRELEKIEAIEKRRQAAKGEQ